MEEYRTKCLELLNADTEQDVFSVINEDPFFDEDNWRPLGGQKNNYGIVENQAGSPMAALTEIIINSVDAILLKHYNKQYSGIDDSPLFSTMDEAVNELISNPSEETITLAADGSRDPMVLSPVVIDKGEGKVPAEFEDTFLGLLEPGSLKQEYEFLQGQYGMGSSGVLPFCGRHGYKLIISAGVNKPEEWTWSIIRKNRDRARYEYYTIDGELPTFSGSLRGQEYGSFVKLYNYQTDNKTQITSDTNLRRYLERYLLESSIPINLEERRDYKSQIKSVITRGGLPHLRDNKEIIEKDFYIEHDFENKHLGRRKIELILLKEKSTLDKSGQRMWENFAGGDKHRQQAVFFTVNGQTHGDQGKSFIKNRCSRPRVADDLLVFVDFSDIAGADLVDLFNPARDRLKQNEISQALLSGLQDAIQGDDVLTDEELTRRQSHIRQETDTSPEEYFAEAIKRNPDLEEIFAPGADLNFFGGGSQSSRSSVSTADIDYDPPFFPTNLNIIEKFRSRVDYDIWEKEGQPFVVQIPVNDTGRVRFELDAPDNYFDRDKSSGELRVIPDASLKSRRLADGVLSLRLKSLPGSQEGDQHSVSVAVENQSSESLHQSLRVEYVEPIEENKTIDEEGDPFKDIAMPDVVGVKEKEWEEHGFDHRDVVRIDDYLEEDNSLTIYVNLDSDPIQNFISRNSLSTFGGEQARTRFKFGVAFNAAVQYIHLKRKWDIQSGLSADDIIEELMAGSSGALLAQLVSDEDLDDWTN